MLCLASIVYWVVLYILAVAWYNPGDHRFTLTVGETWQVIPPVRNLWARTSLQIQSFPFQGGASNNGNGSSSSSTTTTTDTPTTGLQVYEFLPVLDYKQHAACPPLTLGDDATSSGAASTTPVLTLHESSKTIHLDVYEYAYDYFHLNQGSIIQLSARVLPDKKQPPTNDVASGATNLYILKGYHTLEALETKKSNQDVSGLQDFRGKSILKRFLGHGGSTVIEYTVPTSDYYIFVYDNAAPGRSTELDVSLSVKMAAHYLPDPTLRPICRVEDTAKRHGCAWIFTNDQDRQRVASTCIIVKAVSPKLDEKLQQWNATTMSEEANAAVTPGGAVPPTVDLELDDSQVVIVQVDAPVGSTKFILLASLPIILLVSIWFLENGQKCILLCRRRRRNNIMNDNNSNHSKLAQAADETTPLTNKAVV
jgi:hypothetical protein